MVKIKKVFVSLLCFESLSVITEEARSMSFVYLHELDLTILVSLAEFFCKKIIIIFNVVLMYWMYYKFRKTKLFLWMSY